MKTTMEDIEKATEREQQAQRIFAAIGMTNISEKSDEERAAIEIAYKNAEAEMMRCYRVRAEAQDRYAQGK
jgi:hypothetical protein